MMLFPIQLPIFVMLACAVLGEKNFDQCVQENGQLLTSNICLPNTSRKVSSSKIVVKPNLHLSSLIELDKKSTSVSAIFDIYFSWIDTNLITNISDLDAVFFLLESTSLFDSANFWFDSGLDRK